MGLGHSDDEMSSYMGASYIKSDWPRKCYNGYHNHLLGWYNEVEWNKDLKSVKLATFVDSEKTAVDEFVTVTVANEYFFQYNVKKEMNENTEFAANRVTIHKTLPSEDTELLAALDVGDVHHLEQPNVYVKVCEAYTTEHDADVVLLSFASKERELCSEQQVQEEEEEEETTDRPRTDPPTTNPATNDDSDESETAFLNDLVSKAAEYATHWWNG